MSSAKCYPQLSIPRLEQKLPSTAGPKMTVLFYKNLPKALKFVFLPYWIVEFSKFVTQTMQESSLDMEKKKKEIK